MESRPELPILVPIEELQTKFKSKLDLYTVMSVDSKLSSFIKYSELFSSADRQMSGFLPSSYPKRWEESKYWLLILFNQAVKNHKAEKMWVPKYKELSTRKIWDYVRELPDLNIYFPDYTEKQCPDKDHLFSLLGALCGEQLTSLIQDARKKRSIHEEPVTEEYVEIKKDILNELQDIFMQKSKYDARINYAQLLEEKPVSCSRKVPSSNRLAGILLSTMQIWKCWMKMKIMIELN